MSKKKAHEINVLSYPIQQESRATEPPPSPPPSSTTHVRPLLLQEAREQILRLLEGLGVAAGGLGAEGDGADGGALEVFRGDEVGVLGARELVEDGADEAAGVLGVAAHAGHDHGHVDVALALAPAVVVGRHADDLEGHLGLARELGLGEQRHADDGTAPGAVHVGLGARRELGALDADGGSLRVQDDALALQVLGAAPDDVGNLGVVGVGEGDVADEAVLEEGEGAVALGAVDDLVRDDEVHGADLLAQGADGGEADDGAHAQRPQGGDVGAGGDLVRRELVVLAVAGQEGDGHAAVFEDQDRRRRITPGRQRVYACDGHVAVDLVEPGAADDGDLDGSVKCLRKIRHD